MLQFTLYLNIIHYIEVYRDMEDIYVLNKNLKIIDVIDAYKSCIWSNRYNDLGDCELYIEASTKNLNTLKMGNYLIRLDDEMICKIKKVELDTNNEDGNYLIITGIDVKSKHYLGNNEL